MGGDELSREDALVLTASSRSRSAEPASGAGIFKQKRWFARYPWSFLLGVVGTMATVGVVLGSRDTV